MSDNGEGILADRLQQINNALKQVEKKDLESASGSGLALLNVQQRLKLLTGAKSSIKLFNIKNNGALTMIKIFIDEDQNA